MIVKSKIEIKTEMQNRIMVLSAYKGWKKMVRQYEEFINSLSDTCKLVQSDKSPLEIMDSIYKSLDLLMGIEKYNHFQAIGLNPENEKEKILDCYISLLDEEQEKDVDILIGAFRRFIELNRKILVEGEYTGENILRLKNMTNDIRDLSKAIGDSVTSVGLTLVGILREIDKK